MGKTGVLLVGILIFLIFIFLFWMLTRGYVRKKDGAKMWKHWPNRLSYWQAAIFYGFGFTIIIMILLKWGNIFVLPTFYIMEGQPISILEAMATKNLVVTTNHAGIPDIFKDKVNGYLVKKNSIKSIQDILTYIATNKSEIEKIATYNKEYFLDNFTVNAFKKNLIKIIK